jgi:hypothetical protein
MAPSRRERLEIPASSRNWSLMRAGSIMRAPRGDGG